MLVYLFFEQIASLGIEAIVASHMVIARQKSVPSHFQSKSRRFVSPYRHKAPKASRHCIEYRCFFARDSRTFEGLRIMLTYLSACARDGLISRSENGIDICIEVIGKSV